VTEEELIEEAARAMLPALLGDWLWRGREVKNVPPGLKWEAQPDSVRRLLLSQAKAALEVFRRRPLDTGA